MNPSLHDLAKMIDHSLLHPTLTDAELEEGCKVAARHGVASVCIKPYAVRRAAQLLHGTGVHVGAVVGFPHGSSSTEVKRLETSVACRDGATEIDMVLNIGKALSGDWPYVEQDIRAVCDEAHAHGARVKVILENDYLAQGGAGLSADDLKRRLCEVCEEAGADWVKTSTGYGHGGATVDDVRLMRSIVGDLMGIKAAGGIRTYSDAMTMIEAGATRLGTSAGLHILDEIPAL